MMKVGGGFILINII